MDVVVSQFLRYDIDLRPDGDALLRRLVRHVQRDGTLTPVLYEEATQEDVRELAVSLAVRISRPSGPLGTPASITTRAAHASDI